MTQKIIKLNQYETIDGAYLNLQECKPADPYFHGAPSAYISSGNVTKLYQIGEKLNSHNYYLSKVQETQIILESIEEIAPVQVLPKLPEDLNPTPEETIKNVIIFIIFMVLIIIISEYMISHWL